MGLKENAQALILGLGLLGNSPETEAKHRQHHERQKLRTNREDPSLKRFAKQAERQASRFEGVVFLEGRKALPGEPPRIALTFDDGPDDNYTVKVLDILRAKKTKATFFVVGEFAVRFPEVIARIRAEGHSIGGHGYHHVDLRKIPSQKVYAEEIMTTDAVLKDQLGQAPDFFRPPYGDISNNEIRLCRNNGRRVVNWSVDSLDWQEGVTSAEITRNIIRGAHDGGIVLLHSARADRSATVAALPGVIDQLRNKGYQFATVPQILESKEILARR
jgi:peptidoglycan-N-acetylglucosamine deacetylase